MGWGLVLDECAGEWCGWHIAADLIAAGCGWRVGLGCWVGGAIEQVLAWEVLGGGLGGLLIVLRVLVCHWRGSLWLWFPGWVCLRLALAGFPRALVFRPLGHLPGR